MKTTYLILILLFVFSGSIFSQREKWRDDKMREKFEQLEKIKLIETLEMNEETTLRFFARKSEHQKQQDQIQDKIKEKIDNLEVIFKSGRVVTVDELKTNINEINALHSEIEKNRTDFINSLSDILSYDQIAKLLIFERNFRDEIRRLIIKDRKPPMDREQVKLGCPIGINISSLFLVLIFKNCSHIFTNQFCGSGEIWYTRYLEGVVP